MIFKYFFLSVFAICYGLLSAAGVFTVLVAVGLVPRFAGKTHTANKVFLYEEAIIFGTIFGCVISIFEKNCHILDLLSNKIPQYINIWIYLGKGFQAIFGLFSGMFIGCLALAIAEMLDSIPIFARRIALRKGIGLAVVSMAIGKFLGSIMYFLLGFGNT